MILAANLPILPKPLIPANNQLREAPDREDGIDVVREELNRLPEENYMAAKRLFFFLNLVAKYSDYNKMVPNNLAIVFAPTLRLRMEVIIMLVEQAPNLFQ